MHLNPTHRPRLARIVPLALAATLLVPTALLAGPPSLSREVPAAAGMSKEGLDKVTLAMREFVDSEQLAGVVSMVARHGKIVHAETYGWQDREEGIPLREDSIFRIYSMTKPIAGVALMTLYEQGKFSLDDPVAKHIPQFANLKVAKEDGPDGMPVVEDADHPMTVRELMSHTGGLTYGLFSRSQVDTLYTEAGVLDRDSTLEQMVEKLSKIPLRQQPGSIWHYSVSVDVQGYLVEVLSGQNFDDYLREHIFEPLGMKDSGFWVPPEKANRFARLYNVGRDGSITSMPNGDDFLTKPAFFGGGGGLVSTAMDYMRFSQMLLNGGELDGVRILKPETVKLMHTNHLPAHLEETAPMYAGNKFGLDFSIVDNPNPASDHALAKGEYWWYGVAGTWMGINPTQDTIVIGMIQSRGGRAARDARFVSKRLAYEAILDPVTP